MAKYYKLIPGENNNWEIAIFLLIDQLFISKPPISQIKFLRADMHSSVNSLTFIEKLLGPIGYVVDKTLNNSISSAITKLEQKGYLTCEDGYCILTNNGLNRLEEIKNKYAKSNQEAIGKNKNVFRALEALDPETRKNILKKFNELSSQ